jgi:hypothetical protein
MSNVLLYFWFCMYIALRHHMNFSSLDLMQDIVYKSKRYWYHWYRYLLIYMVGFITPASLPQVSRFESLPGPGGIPP